VASTIHESLPSWVVVARGAPVDTEAPPAAEVEHLREAPAPAAAEEAAAYRRGVAAAAAKRTRVAPGATANTATAAAAGAGAGAARARPFTRTGPTRRAAAYAHLLPSAAILQSGGRRPTQMQCIASRRSRSSFGTADDDVSLQCGFRVSCRVRFGFLGLLLGTNTKLRWT